MTTIDIHNVTRVFVLDSKETSFDSSRRTILILTEDGSHNLEITVYGKKPNIPVIVGDCEDE
jgi:phosphohistidine swiveling domain-containing protein